MEWLSLPAFILGIVSWNLKSFWVKMPLSVGFGICMYFATKAMMLHTQEYHWVIAVLIVGIMVVISTT